jgi:hypothetical protein
VPPGFFNGFGNNYGSPALPAETYGLLHESINASDSYRIMGSDQREQVEEMFFDSIYSGDRAKVADWLDLLGIEWDAEDWETWRDAYSAVH